jgi:malate dehydrogenase (oxaloacetate-decarboxylating)(NADP+)
VALLSHSQLRLQQPALGREDARALALLQAQATLARGRRRDARRRRARPPYRDHHARLSTLNGEANLLVMPNIDAANISYNLLKTAAGGGIAIGPVLLGAAKPVHILTPSATVRRIVNMTALTVADAKTPGSRDRGARRIVCGGAQATLPMPVFIPDDHYTSFRRIVQ